MISPVGSLLARFDATLTGSVDTLVNIMQANVGTPLILTATIFYMVQGFKLANGDATPMHGFVPQLIRIGMVLFFATNMQAFNYYVRGLIMDGLPAALSGVVSTGTGSKAASDINATGALLDALYAQVWIAISSTWALAGFSLTGVVAGIAGLLTGLFGGLSLMLVGLVVVGARFTMGIVCVLAPALIGCAIFDYTRPIFDRAVGYVVALIVLIAAAAITVNVMVLGSQWFLARTTEAIIAATTNGDAAVETTQVLVSLCLWFLASGWMMLQLKPLAHSIGGGIASGSPSLYGLSLLTGSKGGGGSAAPAGGGASAPLSLSMARMELSGGGMPPPPPPPPSITYSTRR